MRFVFLNQAFHPDVVSSAQHLTDLATDLAGRGHQITVLAARRGYDSPAACFPPEEIWRGVRILRLRGTAFGKTARWRRASDFLTFLLHCAWRLLFLPRPDVVVALTSPPLISVLGACFAALRRCRFCCWVMDLNPDEAIAAGWLASDSVLARLLQSLSTFSLRRADLVVAMDRFMRDRLLARRVAPEKVIVVPPWSQDDCVRFDPIGRHLFRLKHGLEHQFVVMYSGNHSPCHPLETLLAAARALAGRHEITFCFVGGGSEFARLEQAWNTGRATALPRRPAQAVTDPGHGQRPVPANPAPNGSPNILCLPYQPLERLSASLSAADLHVVLMGDRFVGVVHPCKIYNALVVGAPILYLGPQPSHLTELLKNADSDDDATAAPNQGASCAFASHGQVEQVVRHIERAWALGPQRRWISPELRIKFSKARLLPLLVKALGAL